MMKNQIQTKDMSNTTVVPCVIVMVGLPARGKTYISKKLSRYLNWIGVQTKVFNIGEYRRRKSIVSNFSDFFFPTNEQAVGIREACAINAVEDAMNYLEKDGQVAVVDGTNTSKKRRKLILDLCSKCTNYRVFFIESLCDNVDVIKANILIKMNTPNYYSSILGIDRHNYFKLLKEPSYAKEIDINKMEIRCEDYANQNPTEAVADFTQRIGNYASIYEPLDEVSEKHLSFIKVFNQGDKYLVNRIQGHLQSRIVYFLMNIRILPRTLYLTRHGESEMNLKGRIGGDGDLSPRGNLYAEKLVKYFSDLGVIGLKVWTSLMKRTIQTAQYIDVPKDRFKSLNEIDAGVCEELTYEEIALKFPKDFVRRDRDKLRYRYPGGESYQDLISRLEPVIMDLEHEENVLVVCHQAVARCLIGYFMNIEADKIPYIKVPLHTVIKLTPMAYGCHQEMFDLDVPAVDTHRERPKNLSSFRSIEEVLETVPAHPL